MTTKDQLIGFLKQQKGSWVSGASLSDHMAISRSAIWKNIRSLKDDGYIIDASPRKGYRLLELSPKLLPQEIRDGLATDIFGKQEIIYVDQTGSTNSLGKELAAKGAAEGTIVIAEMQTGGRGRMGRQWYSPPHGGIYVSLILRPPLAPADAPKITLMTGVAVAEALLATTPLQVQIKWPNDILVNGKKLAGILTEISMEMDHVEYIVVGIGLNVNTDGFSDEITTIATSIFLETGELHDRVAIVREILMWFEKYYRVLLQNGFKPILERWKELSSIIGRRIRVGMIDRDICGIVRYIDEDGGLILEDEQGASQRIVSGDVTLV